MKIEQTSRNNAPQTGKLVTLDWYRTLSRPAAHAFWASFLGYALDAFDYQIFSFTLIALLFLPETRGKHLIAVD